MFFEKEENFLVEPFPRIKSVTLRRGTRYYVDEGGRSSTPRVLDHATEVKVVMLASEPGRVGCYTLPDGTDIFVRFEDEIRDEDNF